MESLRKQTCFFIEWKVKRTFLKDDPRGILSDALKKVEIVTHILTRVRHEVC